MSSLSRQGTRESILSWWSDRNPPGATIDLHAASKPLMKLLYHQQVLGLIKRNRGTPLSAEVIQSYLDYLAFKYLWSSTRKVILAELATRVESVEDAHTVVASLGSDQITHLFDARNPEVREWTSEILGRLAGHESTVMTVLKLKPCLRLVSLLHDKDSRVVRAAIFAVSQITYWADGAQAAVEAEILDHLTELLESPHPQVRRWTSRTVRHLAIHKSTVAAVLELESCVLLVALSTTDDIDFLVRERAMYALSRITNRPVAAQSVVNTKKLNNIMQLLHSQNTQLRRWTCWTVANLASHKSSALPVLMLEPFSSLLYLLRDEDAGVVEGAVCALSRITYWPEGAREAAEIHTLKPITKFLESRNAQLRRWTSKTISNLAMYKSSVMAVLRAEPCVQLVSLLRDEDVEVIRAAMFALSMITNWVEGAQAAVNAEILDHFMECLESPNTLFRRWMCWTVGRLARYGYSLRTVLHMNACSQLVSRFCDEDAEVVEAAIYSVSEIAYWRHGAQAVVKCKILDHITDLLASPNSQVRRWTCWTVGHLALHDDAALLMALFAFEPCMPLAALLCDEDAKVIEAAMYALSRIAYHPTGARAVVRANTADQVTKLLGSSYSEVRRWTCWTVGRLARRDSTASVALALNLCAPLVSLLRDEHIEVIEAAIFALSHFVRWPSGAEAAVKSQMLDHVKELESPDVRIRKWTDAMLRNLAKHEPPVVSRQQLLLFSSQNLSPNSRMALSTVSGITSQD